MIRFDAIQKAREWVASLQVRPTPKLERIDPPAPRYPAEDLLSLVNPDIRKPFDMSEVLLRIVDDSRLSVFKPKYGPNIITAWARIMGKTTACSIIQAGDPVLTINRIPRWYCS
jgi:acetyl-CoA carboxylase carboxyltransferase component